ncbi:MAG: cytochrome c oxidase assembly protein [Betaproteobacteria bacterium]
MGGASGALAVYRMMGALVPALWAPVAAAHDAGTRALAQSAPPHVESEAGAAIIVVALAVSAVLYAIGIVRLWRAAAPGRGVRIREVGCFAAGWGVVAIALLGPIETWASRSFAAHMAQHELLMLAAAPVLVLGRPLAVWTWALPRKARNRARRIVATHAWRRVWRAATRPLGATLLQAIALLAWHVPAAFDRAAAHAGLHALQHATFLATALCFWWALRVPAQRAAGGGAVGIVCLFLTMMATGALGALLTFAPVAWYHAYAGSALPWAASALEDQQVGGLVMWIPGGTVYVVGALVIARGLLARRAEVAVARPRTIAGLEAAGLR